MILPRPRFPGALIDLIQLIVFFAAAINAAPDCLFNASYPRSYVALATNSSPVIDGVIDDDFWRETPWTEAFVDISTDTPPPLLTRAKIRWDKEWLCASPRFQRPVIQSFMLRLGMLLQSCKRRSCGQTSREPATASILLMIRSSSTTTILRCVPCC